jgi:hypothetical protein
MKMRFNANKLGYNIIFVIKEGKNAEEKGV